EARGDLAKAREVMFDHESAVVAEAFGLHIVLDEILEALRAVHIQASALRLGAAKKAEFHGFCPICALLLMIFSLSHIVPRHHNAFPPLWRPRLKGPCRHQRRN